MSLKKKCGLSFEANPNPLEKVVTEYVDIDTNHCVPLFILASYARDVEDDPIVSDGYYERLERKVLTFWDSLEHEHKEKLAVDSANANVSVVEFPSGVQACLDEIKEAYK